MLGAFSENESDCYKLSLFQWLQVPGRNFCPTMLAQGFPIPLKDYQVSLPKWKPLEGTNTSSFWQSDMQHAGDTAYSPKPSKGEARN